MSREGRVGGGGVRRGNNNNAKGAGPAQLGWNIGSVGECIIQKTLRYRYNI